MEPLSIEQRADWNNLQDHVENTGGNLDTYKAINPDTKITPEHIPVAVAEVNSLKEGKPIGKMTPAQAKYAQSGMSTDYKSDSSNVKYPVSSTHGVDLETHATVNGPKIPAPDYADQNSRLNYAKLFTAKYGPLMQGRGDTPLRINEKPENATDTAKNISIKAAKSLGLNPALLYSSAMEEGMSGLFPNKSGEVDDSGDKDFPTQGSASFGLDNFVKDFPGLVKKGYLPAEFASRFKAAPSPDPNETQNSANYKTPDDALQAKAAILKLNYDQADEAAKKKGITLSPKARDFFALVNYNAGATNGRKMLEDYNNAGALKDDKFLQERPTSGKGLKAASWKQPYTNVIRRIKMADALQNEGLF